MFRFADPSWLWLALPLALGLVAAWWRLDRLTGLRARLAEVHLLEGLGATDASWRARRRQVALIALALGAWVLALANPQWGTRTRLTTARTTELVVALDVSASMLAADLAPSRLARAQRFVGDLLGTLGGERVGLVLFAGEAYLQAPLTSDYAAVAQYAAGADPARVGEPGTNFAAALRLARQLMARPVDPAAPPPPPTRRLLLVVSDGENHEPEAEAAARELAEAGVRVLTAGIGTATGARVPGGLASASAFKVDANGEPVISRFSPETLARLAELGDGRYFDLNTGGAAAAREIAAYVASQNLGTEQLERFEESASYYQLFVALGLALALGAWASGRGIEIARVRGAVPFSLRTTSRRSARSPEVRASASSAKPSTGV